MALHNTQPHSQTATHTDTHGRRVILGLPALADKTHTYGLGPLVTYTDVCSLCATCNRMRAPFAPPIFHTYENTCEPSNQGPLNFSKNIVSLVHHGAYCAFLVHIAPSWCTSTPYTVVVVYNVPWVNPHKKNTHKFNRPFLGFKKCVDLPPFEALRHSWKKVLAFDPVKRSNPTL